MSEREPSITPPDQEPTGPELEDGGVSPTRLLLRRLRRSKIAVIGAVILAVFYFIALFGGFFSPYTPMSEPRGPSGEELTHSFHPPTRIHFFDADGHFHLRPFIYRHDLVDPDYLTYEADTSVRHPLRLFVRGEPYRLWGLIPVNIHFVGTDGGARFYLFGADRIGRDVLSRLIEGGQVSLSIGLIGIVITMTLGLLVGGIAGHFGGGVDTLLMRLVELLMSIPALYLILACRTTLPDDMSSVQRYMLIILILGLIGWAGTARVIRGMVLSLREREYVLASRALGAGHLRLITRHLLPNTFTYVIVAATLAVPYYILGEVALSFLGLGIDEPQTSWGLMLKAAQDVEVLRNFRWMLLPGYAIFFTVLAFNFLGDGLRDALDPKSRR